MCREELGLPPLSESKLIQYTASMFVILKQQKTLQRARKCNGSPENYRVTLRQLTIMKNRRLV